MALTRQKSSSMQDGVQQVCSIVSASFLFIHAQVEAIKVELLEEIGEMLRVSAKTQHSNVDIFGNLLLHFTQGKGCSMSGDNQHSENELSVEKKIEHQVQPSPNIFSSYFSVGKQT